MLKKSRKKVGKPTGETTKSGRPVYIDDDTGERRSEFSRTIKLKNGKCISCNAENISLEKKFNIVWVSHVLEHMISPQNFLNNINKHLVDNGILFIEVPNCENRRVLKTSIEKVPHTFHYSIKSLQLILERNNFRIKKNDYFKPASKINGIQNKIFKKIHPYYPRIISNSNDGKYFRIIAQKKN